MKPKIKSGQLVTVEPIQDHAKIKKGTIVLCKVKGNHYVHLVQAVKGTQFKIGNNKGRTNGWVSSSQIFGTVTKVID